MMMLRDVQYVLFFYSCRINQFTELNTDHVAYFQVLATVSAAGLSHGLTPHCRAQFRWQPLIHGLTANPTPGPITHDLTSSCPNVSVIWESGGQLRQ